LSFVNALGEYAESPKNLKVSDRVRVDVDAERLEELQTQRDAWDQELAKVCRASASYYNVTCLTV